jgi:hypothetical protein
VRELAVIGYSKRGARRTRRHASKDDSYHSSLIVMT